MYPPLGSQNDLPHRATAVSSGTTGRAPSQYVQSFVRLWVMIGCLIAPTIAHAQVRQLTQNTGHRFDLPAYRVKHGSGNFTGFNSVDLQKIYIVQKQSAIRAQISPRGGQKPCLGRLPNGDLLATQQLGGVIALCRSTDSGFSWSAPQIVKVPGRENLPGRAPMFSALSDGTLLLGYNGMYRSLDEGKTWQQCQVHASVTFDEITRDASWGENSGPHELSDGTVICCGYVNVVPGHGRAYLFRSTDRGHTWGNPSLIADYCSEVNLAVLPDDRLFACLRQGTRFGEQWAGEGGVVLSVASSDDGGRTWSAPRRILGKAQSPGFPVRLHDGRLIIVYTHRQSPHGVQAIASLDDGRTWDVDHPVIIAWNSFDAYCGHPRSLVLPDDSIVSGFYVRAFHSRSGPGGDVVGHCVRWRAPDNWPAQWPPAPAAVSPPAGKKPVLDLPPGETHRVYSGYNSLELQEIWFTEKQSVVRSQISPRGGHKPCLTRLPNGELLATQMAAGHAALCYSTDDGDSWGSRRTVEVFGSGDRIPGPARQLAALDDGTLLLAHDTMYRSADQGRSWKPCPFDNIVHIDGRQLQLRPGESNGPHRLSDGTVVCTADATLNSALLDVHLAVEGRDGLWEESNITWNNAPNNYNTFVGAVTETHRVGGTQAELSSQALVDALNADTNDIFDLRLFAGSESHPETQLYYATKENKKFPAPRLYVEFVDSTATTTETVVLEPTDDALTRGGRHADANNESSAYLDIDSMWISGPNRQQEDQQKGYLRFDLSPVTGQVVSARLSLSKLNGTTFGTPIERRTFLLRSADGGRSWGDATPIAAAREVNLAVLPDGRLFGCVTLNEVGGGPGAVGVLESTDGGHHWTAPRRIDGLGSSQIPGSPLALPDGRLLIIYGNRQLPFGVQAIASRDGGRTWDTDHPLILAWFSWDYHCGNPRSVLLQDGSILTAYYARMLTEAPDGIVYTPTDRDPNPDVVAHSLRWSVPDDWPPVP